MKYKLRTSREIDYSRVNIEDYLLELLTERGINNPTAWLNTSKEDELEAKSLCNIDLACSTLNETLESDNPIVYIQADSDTDGYTSAAIINRFIAEICPTCVIEVNLHPGKQHGVNLEAAISSSSKLIIIPDAGTNEIQEQSKIIEKGKKYIILDHHEIESSVSIENKPIVNSQYNYGNPGLSGAGVALKFCIRYMEMYEIKDLDMDLLYALAAIGIVADVMDLQNLENKYIIKTGLSKMYKHSFLKELMKDNRGNYIENPSQKDIGWTIGPNINAVVRLGDMDQKRMLFNSLVEPNHQIISTKRGDINIVVPLFEEMVRICKNIKAKQSRLVKKGMDLIQEMIDNGEINLNNNLIVFIDKGRELPFELSGLIANKLLSTYKRPVILLKHYEDLTKSNNSEKEWRGSVRGSRAEGCESLKDVLEKLSGVTFAQGHAFAHGIGISQDSYDSFYCDAIDTLNKIDFNTQLYIIDLIMNTKDFNKDIGALFAEENIWGQGIEKPLTLLKDIDCLNSEFMGADNQHTKISLPNVNVVIFDNKDLVEKLMKSRNYNMNAIGEFSWDTYESEPKLQFIVQELELVEGTTITSWSDF